MKLPSLAEIRKIVVYVLGGVAELISLGVLHGTVLAVATGVIFIATGAGIYQAKNTAAKT